MARRILIEDFDEQTNILAQAPTAPDSSTTAALDGGAAPAAGEAGQSDTAAAVDAIDAGGPPEWLTQAIGDATTSTTAQSASGAYDAGPAPEA